MIITRKQVWALSTVGVVAITYAIIGTSAFADNASATVPVTSADQSAFSWGSRDQGHEEVGNSLMTLTRATTATMGQTRITTELAS